MQTSKSQIEKLFERFPELTALREVLFSALDELLSLYERDGILFLAGNGGSAADCEHICGELMKGFKSKRPLSPEVKKNFADLFGQPGSDTAEKLQNGLRAVSLLSHPGLASAFSNDVDPQLCFAQQLWALGRPGDVFFGISTGGNSKNVLQALMTARVKGIKSILLTGNRKGICEKFADIVIAAPESETYRIQEYHLPIYHALCLALEENIFSTER
ncbi:MAG: SIS domain-containing protein [Victivallaceae bacterium]|nr:SIS domain-containing protein [Victivallaceae bacterium]